MRLAWAILGASLAFFQAAAARSAGEPVDLALVLLADVSRSVDAARYAMQKEGYRAAFRDPNVVAAILGGYAGARAARRLKPDYVRAIVVAVGFLVAAWSFRSL